ncbi:hypothetical protein ABK040_000910 [Willaertia magna]
MGGAIGYATHTGYAITFIDDNNNTLNNKKEIIHSLLKSDPISGKKYLTLEGIGKYFNGPGKLEGFIESDLLKEFYNNMSFNGSVSTVDYKNRKWMIKKEETKRLPLKLPEFKGPFVNYENKKITTMEQLDEVMNYCKRSKYDNNTLQNSHKPKISFHFKLNTLNDISIITTNENENHSDYNNHSKLNYNSVIDNKIIFTKIEKPMEPNYKNVESYLDESLKGNISNDKNIAKKISEDIDFDYLTVQVYKAQLEE